MIETIRTAHAAFHNIPIVLVSENCELVQRAYATEAGCCGFLVSQLSLSGVLVPL